MADGPTMTMRQGAKFVHDCDRCGLSGHYEGHDLYRCEQGGVDANLPTIIARFGDRPHEYRSGQEVKVGKLLLQTC